MPDFPEIWLHGGPLPASSRPLWFRHRILPSPALRSPNSWLFVEARSRDAIDITANAYRLVSHMAQAAFSSDFQSFCLKYAVPPPGATFIPGSPLAKRSQNFTEDLRVQERALFERLLLFEKVQLSVAGPNVIAPLLCNQMSVRVFEELLEQDALTFVVWEPSPMMAHKDGEVQETFVGRIDRGGPLDIEQRIVDGLANEVVAGLNTAARRKLTKKLLQQHTLIDQTVVEQAWPVALKAMAEGRLEAFGLAKRDQIIGSPVSVGNTLVKATESILRYRHVLANDLATLDDPGVFDLLAIGLTNLERPSLPLEQFATLAEFEKFPNLSELYVCLDEPFRRIAKFRNSTTAKNFRNWLSTLKTGSDIDLIREYVDACANRTGLFETAPRKFLKLVTMLAVGTGAGAGAAALGAEAIVSAATGIMVSTAAEVIGKATDFGLGLFESFIIDNFKVGWSPKSYFDGLRKLTRADKEA